MEYELIRAGVRLRDCPSKRLNWADVWVIVSNAPHDAPLVREMLGDAWNPWTADTYLLAGVFDALQVANWQRTPDGHKGRNAPKPVPRPGEDAASSTTETKHYGTPTPISELIEGDYF